MLPKVTPARTKAWNKLKEHYKMMKSRHMADLFRRDKESFSSFSIRFEDILLDYSKNKVTKETMRLLFGLARECMLTGDKINKTEKRAVLHVALRNRSNTPIYLDGKDVMPEVNADLGQMSQSSERIILGEWEGYTGKRIMDIVNTNTISTMWQLSIKTPLIGRPRLNSTYSTLDY